MAITWSKVEESFQQALTELIPINRSYADAIYHVFVAKNPSDNHKKQHQRAYESFRTRASDLDGKFADIREFAVSLKTA